MKLLMVVYDEDLDSQVTAIFDRDMVVSRYSKIEGVVGARMDTLADTEFDPGHRNNMLWVVAQDEMIQRLAGNLRRLREQEGWGIRGVVTNAEELI